MQCLAVFLMRQLESSARELLNDSLHRVGVEAARGLAETAQRDAFDTQCILNFSSPEAACKPLKLVMVGLKN